MSMRNHPGGWGCRNENKVHYWELRECGVRNSHRRLKVCVHLELLRVEVWSWAVVAACL